MTKIGITVLHIEDVKAMIPVVQRRADVDKSPRKFEWEAQVKRLGETVKFMEEHALESVHTA